SRLLHGEILPEFEQHGIRILRWSELTADQRLTLSELFRNSIFPVLTPLAVDPAHPFPYISGLSLNLAVIIRDIDSGQEHFARVKIPHNVPRFVRVDRNVEDENAFVPAEEIIAAHLSDLFQGMEIVEHHVFRVTRNADMEVEEDRDEDLLQALERELARRRLGSAARLEIAEDMTPRRWSPRRPRRSASGRPPGTSSPLSARAMCSSSIPTIPSPPPSNASSSRPRRTTRCWRSSRPCTGPRATPRSSTPWSMPPRR